MKKIIFIVLVVFVIGWCVRVFVPYWKSKSQKQELRQRRQAMSALMDAVYNYAETNSGQFPQSLDSLTLAGGGFAALTPSNYYYKTPEPHPLGHIESDKIVLAEKDYCFPGKRVYLLGLRGKWVVLRPRDEYVRLLIQNGITNDP